MKLLLTLALVGPCRLGSRLMRLAVAYPMAGSRTSTQRLLDVLFRLGDTLERLPTRWHGPAKALGLVCDRHYDEAPPWWEFEVDCAGHDCGVCWTCAPATQPQLLEDEVRYSCSDHHECSPLKVTCEQYDATLDADR